MRYAFGEFDPDEIDIIEPDPRAFGPAAHSPLTEAATNDPSLRRRRRPALIAGAAILATLTATTAIWRPWGHDNRQLSLPTATVANATMTERLVIGDAASAPSGSWLPTSIAAPAFAGLDDAVGYFFAAPGATMSFDGTGNGRWAAFTAIPEDSDGATPVRPGNAAGITTVQGAPAQITPRTTVAQLEVSFGPIDGYMFSLASAGLSRIETLALAEVVGIDDGVPVVRDRNALRDLRPLGSIASYYSVVNLLISAQGSSIPAVGTVSVEYGERDTSVTLASHAVEDPLWRQMAEFILRGRSDRSVHGQQAIAVALHDLDVGAGAGTTVVCWEEGGRMIMLTSHVGVDATVSLAASVRPATDEEWSAIVSVEGRGSFSSVVSY